MKPKFSTFILLWLTQGLSSLGSALTNYAFILWFTLVIFPDVGERSQLTFTLTMITLLMVLPYVCISPIAGVWVDRLDRKKIMIVADVILAILTLVMIGYIHFYSSGLAPIFLLLALISLVGAFHSLAFDSSYILIVSEDHLGRANGMMQTMHTLTGVLGPILAATLFIYYGRENGLEMILLIDAMTFLISAFCIVFFKIPSPLMKEIVQEVKSTYWIEIKEGFFYLKQQKQLLGLLLLGFILTFVVSSDFLLPLVVKDQLLQNRTSLGWSYEFSYSFVESMGLLGGAIAGVVMGIWGGPKKYLISSILVTCCFVGFFVVGLGATSLIWLAGPFFSIRLFSEVLFRSIDSIVWQKTVPPAMQGRVFGLKRLFAYIAAPLGTVILGWFASHTSTSQVLIPLGLVLVLITGIIGLGLYFLRVIKV
ncbi:MFS transporter [Hazenella sp. IB182357]|uniref:MFS transporter n=1 Tax=Polycladospora coralii TaxID=2771432 RepID=A0A926RV67_9BACL|nr:MFS transporter [Polycladospora coralii]MBD1373858.1 MFS transporter [Polycladospora coralii]